MLLALLGFVGTIVLAIIQHLAKRGDNAEAQVLEAIRVELAGLRKQLVSHGENVAAQFDKQRAEHLSLLKVISDLRVEVGRLDRDVSVLRAKVEADAA